MQKNRPISVTAFLKKFFLKNKTDIVSISILFFAIYIFLFPSFIQKDLTGDFIGQEVSWYHFTFINLKEGIIPFWSPYAFSGIPHLLKPELAIFHPLTLLTMLLGFIFNTNGTIDITGQLMEIVGIFSLCLAAIGVYIFSRKILNLGPIPALFASFAYALNPFTIFQLHSTSIVYGVALLPWLLFFLLRFIYYPSFFSFLLVVICNYLLFIGYTYHYVYFFFMELSLVLFINYRRFFFFFISIITALLLASIFLTSYADIYSQSPRNSNNYDLYFHSFASLHQLKITEIVSPVSLTSDIGTTEFAKLFEGPTLTWGTFAFLFLLIGLFSLKKNALYVWIVAIFFIGLLYGFGGNLQTHSFFGNLLPIIYKFRFHARAFIVVIFAGALLIGLGVQAIQEQRRIKFIELFFWAFFLLLFSGLILGEIYFPQRLINNIEMVKGITTTLIFLFASLILTALSIKYARKAFLAIGLILMLIELNIFFQNFPDFFTKNISYGQFYKINSLIPELPNNNNLFRMYFEDNQFAYNTSIFGIYNSNGYENNPSPTLNERYHRYGVVRFYQTTNVKYVVTTNEKWEALNPKVIKIKTVTPQSLPKETYFHSPEKNHYIYQIKNYLPRFYVPEQAKPCNNKTCLVEDNPPKVVTVNGLEETITNPKNNISIKVEEYSPNTVKMEINAPQKTYIASSEILNKGWSLKINGQEATLYDTSNGLRGFIAPQGNSEIVMNYFPPQFVLGALLAAIGGLSLFIIWRTRFIEKSDTIIHVLNKRLKKLKGGKK